MAARTLLQRRAAPLAASLLVGAAAFSPSLVLAEAQERPRHPKKPIYDDPDYVPTTTATLLPASQPKAPSSPSSSLSQSSSLSSSSPSSSPSPSPSPPSPASSTLPPSPERPAAPSLASAGPRQHHRVTPTDRLAAQVREGRLVLYRHASAVEDAVNGSMARAFRLEKTVAETVASVAPAPETGERLMPGTVYVLVATMAGSIVARRRSLLLRATVPAALGLAAACALLPVTTANAAALVWTYEQRFPALADSHRRLSYRLDQALASASAHALRLRTTVDQNAKATRQSVQDWLKKGR